MIYFVFVIYIMRFKDILNSEFGKIAISILLGIGLSSMFRKTCKDKDCLEFRGPAVEDVETSMYRFGNDCYKFRSMAVPCDPSKVKVNFA